MEQLDGYTEKLVFSFLDPSLYGARDKLKTAGYEARTFSEDEKVYIAWNISEMAEERGIQVAACADPALLSEYGIYANKCIDDGLIRKTFSHDKDLMTFIGSAEALESSGQREHCHCIPSYDVGTENTCRNGCVYCYANDSEEAIEKQLESISKNEAMLAAPN